MCINQNFSMHTIIVLDYISNMHNNKGRHTLTGQLQLQGACAHMHCNVFVNHTVYSSPLHERLVFHMGDYCIYLSAHTVYASVLHTVYLSEIVLPCIINVDMLVAFRTCPYQNCSNLAKQVMSTLNLSLQSMSLARKRMSDEA